MNKIPSFTICCRRSSHAIQSSMLRHARILVCQRSRKCDTLTGGPRGIYTCAQSPMVNDFVFYSENTVQHECDETPSTRWISASFQRRFGIRENLNDTPSFNSFLFWREGHGRRPPWFYAQTCIFNGSNRRNFIEWENFKKSAKIALFWGFWPLCGIIGCFY